MQKKTPQDIAFMKKKQGYVLLDSRCRGSILAQKVLLMH